MRRKLVGLTMERCRTIVSELEVNCTAGSYYGLHRKVHPAMNFNAPNFTLYHCTLKCVGAVRHNPSSA